MQGHILALVLSTSFLTKFGNLDIEMSNRGLELIQWNQPRDVNCLNMSYTLDKEFVKDFRTSHNQDTRKVARRLMVFHGNMFKGNLVIQENQFVIPSRT